MPQQLPIRLCPKAMLPELGWIFYINYPGGGGLTNGAVFGKIAGASAAKAAHT